MNEMLIVKPKYKVTHTSSGVWKEYQFDNGNTYARYTSNARFMGRPVVSVTYGVDPETGSMAMADGVIAIGQRAQGWVSIGQFVNGYISIGQFATGRIFALGQFAIAPLAIGQASIAVLCIAQSGIAMTGIFQSGITVLGGIGQFVLNVGSYLGI